MKQLAPPPWVCTDKRAELGSRRIVVRWREQGVCCVCFWHVRVWDRERERETNMATSLGVSYEQVLALQWRPGSCCLTTDEITMPSANVSATSLSEVENYLSSRMVSVMWVQRLCVSKGSFSSASTSPPEPDKELHMLRVSVYTCCCMRRVTAGIAFESHIFRNGRNSWNDLGAPSDCRWEWSGLEVWHLVLKRQNY